MAKDKKNSKKSSPSKVEKQTKYVPTLRKLYNDEIVGKLKKVFHYRTPAQLPKKQFMLFKRKHLRLKVCIFDQCFCESPLPELKFLEILGPRPRAERAHRLSKTRSLLEISREDV